MSCDDDYDDGWYDEIYDEIKDVFNEVRVKLLTKDSLIKIENSMQECIKQKLCKLNILFQNLDIYSYKDYLFINDKYNIVNDLEKIVTSFGMDIKPILTNLKGKSYIATDKLVKFLELIGSDYDFGKDYQKLNDNSIAEMINSNTNEFTDIINRYSGLNELLMQIRENDYVLGVEKQTIKQHFVNSKLQNTEVLNVKSNVEDIKNKLHSFIDNIEEQVKENNNFMQNGTTNLLEYRARQMGYSIEKQQLGDEIQLVLVRL